MVENNASGDNDDSDFNDDNGDGHIHYLYQKWQMYFFLFCWTSHSFRIRIIILSSFQRWQASPAYSLPVLPSFFLSLLHSGDCVGVVCLCKWPLHCLCRFCGCFVFLFLILLIPSTYDCLFLSEFGIGQIIDLISFFSVPVMAWHVVF